MLCFARSDEKRGCAGLDLELAAVEALMPRDELGMRAILDDPARLKHKNSVEALDGR